MVGVDGRWAGGGGPLAAGLLLRVAAVGELDERERTDHALFPGVMARGLPPLLLQQFLGVEPGLGVQFALELARFRQGGHLGSLVLLGVVFEPEGHSFALVLAVSPLVVCAPRRRRCSVGVVSPEH